MAVHVFAGGHRLYRSRERGDVIDWLVSTATSNTNKMLNTEDQLSDPTEERDPSADQVGNEQPAMAVDQATGDVGTQRTEALGNTATASAGTSLDGRSVERLRS